MRHFRAIALVTALGALGGTFVALASWFLYAWLSPATPVGRPIFGGIAQLGALYGAALGPVLGFGLLRRVPLGRAIIGTALGAISAVALCAVMAPDYYLPFAGPVGMLCAALVLRRRAPRDAPPAAV